MFNIIKKIFKKPEVKRTNSSIKSNSNSHPKSKPKSKNKTLNTYFREELRESNHIKKEAHKTVIDHLSNKININKTGNKLTAQEKKDLGINPRLTITHELVDVLTASGLAQPDPKKVLSTLFYRASFYKNNDESIKQYRKLGVEYYEIMGCNDEAECEWCKSMDGQKLSINSDINSLIKENCKCDSHCRLTTLAIT